MNVHIWTSIYGHSYRCARTSYRGYQRGKPDDHIEPETDSDGDGGTASKLRGSGHIELSQKGIPHGVMHFVEQLVSAGHIYMHDTCAPEASHPHVIKGAMDRVRKGNAETTSTSMVDWVWRVRTWAEIIEDVNSDHVKQKATTRRLKRGVFVIDSSLILPHSSISQQMTRDCCSPLRAGGNNLITPDARISYHEVICANI